MYNAFFAYEMPRVKSADSIGGLAVPLRSAPVNI